MKTGSDVPRAAGRTVPPEAHLRPLGLKMLVVGADRQLLHSVKSHLRPLGLALVGASDGAAALGLAQKHHPSLVLLDATSLGPDAYTVCRRLRSSWRFGNPSIILLTGGEHSRDWGRGLAAGADDFIATPVDPAELVGRVRAALHRLQEMRSSSPLTGLPGNVQIHRELERRVTGGDDVALLYVDFDNFKAYGDRYGFLRGDEAIVALADVLREAAEGRDGIFVGHVGGDDFIVLTRPEEAEEFARQAISLFKGRVEGLYDPKDAARGWIENEDRQGNLRRFPLLTVSIGIATNRDKEIKDHRELVDLATEMKHYAKTRLGSAVAVDRRGGNGKVPEGPEGEEAEREVRARTRRRAGRAGALRRSLVAGAAALVVLFVVGGPATVVMAQNAQPGDALWPVKLRIEDLRLALESDPDRDVALRLEFASRRVEELGSLLTRGEDADIMRRVTENLMRHTEEALGGLAGLHPMEAMKLLGRVELALAEQVDVLQGLADTACGGEGPGPSPSACYGLRMALGNSHQALSILAPEPGEPGDEAAGRGRGRGKDKEPPGQSKDKEPPGKGKDKGPPGKGKDKEPPGSRSQKAQARGPKKPADGTG